MKYFRFIRSYSLLVAGLVLVIHMIVPHDHHLNGSDNGDKESCPVTGENHQNHPVFPAHCHAFNDLAAEKFTPVIDNKANSNAFAPVIWLPEELIHECLLTRSLIHNSPVLLQELHLSDFSPFRAPPFLS